MACSHTSYALTHAPTLPPIYLPTFLGCLHMLVDLFGHLFAAFSFANRSGHGIFFFWHATKYSLAFLSYDVS